MLTPIIDEALENINEEVKPSLGYRLDTEKERITSLIDNLAAVRQAALMILATEQGLHNIYAPEYGLKVRDLIGKPYHYVANELQRRVKEALLTDERITGVHSFSSSRQADQLLLTFTVDTIFGDFNESKAVAL